jgi:3-methyladenine DNA glycosylase/8-oxoguanine DNA glycosylase
LESFACLGRSEAVALLSFGQHLNQIIDGFRALFVSIVKRMVSTSQAGKVVSRIC